jgi:hypothetical protein
MSPFVAVGFQEGHNLHALEQFIHKVAVSLDKRVGHIQIKPSIRRLQGLPHLQLWLLHGNAGAA